jgi:hypothetical protein
MKNKTNFSGLHAHSVRFHSLSVIKKAHSLTIMKDYHATHSQTPLLKVMDGRISEDQTTLWTLTL